MASRNFGTSALSALMLVLSLAPLVRCAQLTKDDIDFRKKVYTDKAGHRLPYRLFVPLGYDSSRKYPLLL